MSLDNIRIFAISKLGWIKEQQRKFLEQERETPREYLDRESHYVWGTRYLLKIVEKDQTPSIELKHRRTFLTVRPGTDEAKKQLLMEEWYREQLGSNVAALIVKWESLLGVKVKRLFVQRMKTKWGSCTPTMNSIRINSDLAKKPPECLEYIVIHEMLHLLEPTHNAHFLALMDRFLPPWKQCRAALNRLPVKHEQWQY
jgi:predicted metal-dependent hydrolase